MSIDFRKCPFMARETVEHLNRLARALERLRTDLPSLASRPEAVELEQRAAGLATDMQNKSIQVGWVGPPASGKSLTVCNVVGAREADSPAPVGAPTCNGPTSITALRLRCAQPGFPPEVASLAFMTDQQFRSRAAAVAKKIGLGYPAEPQTMLREIDEQLAQGSTAERRHDLMYLKRLLTAYVSHHSLLGTEDRFGDYQKRSQYVGAAETGGEKFTLLREVIIDYPTTRLPPVFNLVDVPGLATSNRVDDTLTDEIVNSLDALFVFQRILADDPFAGIDLYNRLSEDLRSRRPPMWLVVTGWDEPGAADATLLDRLARAVEDAGITVPQVLPIANRLAQAMIAAGDLPLSDLLLRHHLSAELPPWFREHAEWHEAYRGLTADGGIGRLVQTIRDQLGDSVRRERAESVQSRLAAAEQDLRGLMHSGRERATMPQESLAAAATAELRLSKLALDLRRDRELSERAARDLIEVLEDQLDKSLSGFCDVDLPLEEMRRLHQLLCRQLEDAARIHAGARDEGTVARIFLAVDAHVTEAGIPAVRAGASDDDSGPFDVPSRWAQQRERDLADASWATDVFRTFHEDEFDGVEGMQVDAYWNVMRRKIRCLVHALVIGVLDRVSGQFAEYRQAMRQLGSDDSPVDPRDRRIFDDILSELGPAESAS